MKEGVGGEGEIISNRRNIYNMKIVCVSQRKTKTLLFRFSGSVINEMKRSMTNRRCSQGHKQAPEITGREGKPQNMSTEGM